MSKKSFVITEEKKEAVQKALKTLEAEKFDLFKSIMGSENSLSSYSAEPSRPYAEGTYGRATDPIDGGLDTLI